MPALIISIQVLILALIAINRYGEEKKRPKY